MFGGGDSFVETLEAIVRFVDEAEPSTDRLVRWHRDRFARVSSGDSIMRRLRYLENVGFLEEMDDRWTLGPHGPDVLTGDRTRLAEVMCTRNVGLRSLLYALEAGPMTIEEVSEQQLATHAELGWDPGEVTMAHQRTNWLRSLGLIERIDTLYHLTAAGRAFVRDAVERHSTMAADDATMTADATTVRTRARVVDPEFRGTVLARYAHRCPVSSVDHVGLLEVAHVLSWADHPEHRADLGNVLPLSALHHAAFDRQLFTIGSDYHLRVNPGFETHSDLLRASILERDETRIDGLDGRLDRAILRRYNTGLGWV